MATTKVGHQVITWTRWRLLCFSSQHVTISITTVCYHIAGNFHVGFIFMYFRDCAAWKLNPRIFLQVRIFRSPVSRSAAWIYIVSLAIQGSYVWIQQLLSMVFMFLTKKNANVRNLRILFAMNFHVLRLNAKFKPMNCFANTKVERKRKNLAPQKFAAIQYIIHCRSTTILLV